MKKELQLCSFGQAIRLKKAGFDWNVTHFYIKTDRSKEAYPFWVNYGCYQYGIDPQNFNSKLWTFKGVFSAPTVALALKWFRDEKKIQNAVCIKDYDGNFDYYYIVPSESCDDYDTYELAESALLDELLNILEKN